MRKPYYIPTVEITILEAEVVMDDTFPMMGSGSHAQAPPMLKSMPAGGVKAF